MSALTWWQWLIVAGGAGFVLLVLGFFVARDKTRDALLLAIGAAESIRRLVARVRGKPDPAKPNETLRPGVRVPKSFGLLTISEFIDKRNREREERKP